MQASGGPTEDPQDRPATDLVDAISVFTIPVVLAPARSCLPTARRRTPTR
jgi:hypothetical protein